MLNWLWTQPEPATRRCFSVLSWPVNPFSSPSAAHQVLLTPQLHGVTIWRVIWSHMESWRVNHTVKLRLILTKATKGREVGACSLLSWEAAKNSPVTLENLYGEPEEFFRHRSESKALKPRAEAGWAFFILIQLLHLRLSHHSAGEPKTPRHGSKLWCPGEHPASLSKRPPWDGKHPTKRRSTAK